MFIQQRMAKNNKENNGSSNKKKSYERSAIDLRFLKATALIIEKNKKAGLKPASYNAISEMVFGERTLISKIKNSKRGVTMLQLEKFAIYFHLDFNCFFRDTVSIDYNPQVMGKEVVSKDNSIASSGANTIINKVKGANSGDINIKGTIYKSNKIGQVIQKAEKIINHTLDTENKQLWDGIIGTIKEESKTLETTIIQQNDTIKKMEKLHKTQLHTEIEKRKEAEQQRDEAREEERKILKKYLNLIEKKG